MKFIFSMLLMLCTAALFSCVSSKKLKASKDEYALLETRYQTIGDNLSDCNKKPKY